jgi:autotransporter translocation and assembly factor TamB
MIRRLLLRLLAFAALALALAAGAVAGLLATTPGARALAAAVRVRLPGLALRVEGGSLARGLRLRDVAWTDGTNRIALASLETRWTFAVSPHPAFHLRRFRAQGLRVVRPPAPPDAPARPWYEALDPDLRSPVDLPDVRLPLDLYVHDAALIDATFDSGNGPQSLRSLHLSASVQGDRLSIALLRLDHGLGRLDLHGDVHLSGAYPLGLALRFRSDSLLPDAPVALDASLDGSLENLRVDATLSTPAAIRLEGQLRPLDPELPAIVRASWTHVAWRPGNDPVAQSPAGRFDLEGSLRDYTMHLDATLRGPSGPALPLDVRANGNPRQFRVEPFSLDLAAFQSQLPERLVAGGILVADADVRWGDGPGTAARLCARVDDALVRVLPDESPFDDDAPPLDFPIPVLALDLALDGPRLEAHFRLDGPRQSALRADASFVFAENRTLADWTGSIDVESFRLAVVQPFVPELAALEGTLNAHVHLSGDLRRPLLRGFVALADGALEPAAFPIRLDNVHLRAELQDRRVQLAGGFRSGDGTATLDGEAERIADEWTASLRLDGQRLELAYGTLAVLQASPRLRLDARPGHLSLAGRIDVPSATVSIQDVPASAVRPSPDAVVLRKSVSDAPPAPPRAPAPALSTAIDLDLHLGDHVQIAGYGLSARLEGQLRLQQDGPNAPRAFGEVRIRDGRYRAYGQRLDVRRGRFLFAGPLDRPDLLVEAVRDVPAYGVLAGLRVEGTPDALSSSLFSEPAMPEEDALAYLLLGRPLERGESPDRNAVLARAALSLGIARGGGRAADLAHRLGVENFQLETDGEGDQTQVVVSGQVTDRLSLGYGMGVFDAGNTLSARYRLARRLYLEAISGIDSSLDLFYSFTF